jgi:hypothetical protein
MRPGDFFAARIAFYGARMEESGSRTRVPTLDPDAK